MKKSIFLVASFFCFFQIYSQSFIGKWVLIVDDDTYAIPVCSMIHLTERN
ncbi:hypothetical protein [Aquimarina hainanensis]